MVYGVSGRPCERRAKGRCPRGPEFCGCQNYIFLRSVCTWYDWLLIFFCVCMYRKIGSVGVWGGGYQTIVLPRAPILLRTTLGVSVFYVLQITVQNKILALTKTFSCSFQQNTSSNNISRVMSFENKTLVHPVP